MTCQNTCNKNSLFESTREARLEALAKAKREEEARKAQVEHLQQIRQSLAVREAKEQARHQALQEAEKAFKIRERDILEAQLCETLESMKRMQDQYQEFVTTTDMIAKKLANPALLFKTSTIVTVDEFDDYFNLTYKDGREVRVPFGLIDFILKSKMEAINDIFNIHTKELATLQRDIGDANDQTAKMADLFKSLVANVAAHETDQQIAFESFKCEIQTKVDSLSADVSEIAKSFKDVVTLVEALNATVKTMVSSN